MCRQKSGSIKQVQTFPEAYTEYVNLCLHPNHVDTDLKLNDEVDLLGV